MQCSIHGRVSDSDSSIVDSFLTSLFDDPPTEGEHDHRQKVSGFQVANQGSPLCSRSSEIPTWEESIGNRKPKRKKIEAMRKYRTEQWKECMDGTNESEGMTQN